jgi:phosphatidylethanolamine-binding protein (PEBP) family uncharacterized protein
MLPEGVGHGVKTEQMGHAVNDFGYPRHDGPAPPKGHGTHHYHFRLAAVDLDVLTEAPDARASDMWEDVRRHTIAEAELVGTYAR